MKSCFSLLFVLCCIQLQAQQGILYYKEMPAGFAQARISKADLRKDVQFWMQVMEESHVNLYHSTSKKQLQALAGRLIHQLPDSVEHKQASLVISRLAASLGEGHLGLVSDPVSDSMYKWHTQRFPYLLREVTEEGFVVEADLSKSAVRLQLGATILSVNGRKASDLSKKYADYFGGLDTWKMVSVKDAIRKLLFMDEVGSPFDIIARQGNDTVRFSVNGFGKKEADSISGVLGALVHRPPPFILRFTESNVAVISFNDMDRLYRQQFAAFLDSSFRLIHERKARGLIIDIRKNGGGDFALGEMLISYFSGKPYRNISAVKYKVSSHSRAWAAFRGENFPFQDKKNGYVYDFKVDALTRPDSPAYRFTGRTALLIGPGTFSSANMLANTIKDYGLATVFGEPTAEPGNDFGELFPFMLPRTHVIATAPIKMFVRANGDHQDFTGIQPDKFVKDTPGGKDEVEEAAIRWLTGTDDGSL